MGRLNIMLNDLAGKHQYQERGDMSIDVTEHNSHWTANNIGYSTTVAAQQQQHVRDDHLVDLNNHAFLHVAENCIILGTTPRTNQPTFSSPYTSSLLTTIGGLVDTSYPIYLVPSLGDAKKMCQE